MLKQDDTESLGTFVTRLREKAAQMVNRPLKKIRLTWLLRICASQSGMNCHASGCLISKL